MGIAVGVWVAVRFAQGKGYTADDAYNVALAAVPGGIIGARALYVLANHSLFVERPLDVFALNEGGISIYGGLIGGVLAGLIFMLWRRYPVFAGGDAAAMGMILGQAVGRIGDIINGEHFSRPFDSPFTVIYTKLNSPGFGRPAPH